jgi:hypothetical protein
MNPQTQKSLERVLDQLDRRARRPDRRLTPAALALAAGLFLGYLLLARLIPQAWPALLANDPATSLRGWPLVVWRLSQACLAHQRPILAGLVASCLVMLVLSYRSRTVRFLVWVAAVGVVVVDAGILVCTLLACLQAAGGDF